MASLIREDTPLQHTLSRLSQDEIERRVAGLGKWFHNLDLRGVKTASDHFLGDYPTVKWQRFAHALPGSLQGKTVFDIGGSSGFY
jgi:tRNA (mo5U34)-methyltransferase